MEELGKHLFSSDYNITEKCQAMLWKRVVQWEFS